MARSRRIILEIVLLGIVIFVAGCMATLKKSEKELPPPRIPTSEEEIFEKYYVTKDGIDIKAYDFVSREGAIDLAMKGYRNATKSEIKNYWSRINAN